MNMVRGITRLMRSLMNIFWRWYTNKHFNIPFLQYNVSFMLYCVVISLQQCLWNWKFTPQLQNEGIDDEFSSPKPCAKDSASPRGGEACGWVVVEMHPLVTFLQKLFSANYYLLLISLLSFPGHIFLFCCVNLKNNDVVKLWCLFLLSLVKI